MGRVRERERRSETGVETETIVEGERGKRVGKTRKEWVQDKESERGRNSNREERERRKNQLEGQRGRVRP